MLLELANQLGNELPVFFRRIRALLGDLSSRQTTRFVSKQAVHSRIRVHDQAGVDLSDADAFTEAIERARTKAKECVVHGTEAAVPWRGDSTTIVLPRTGGFGWLAIQPLPPTGASLCFLYARGIPCRAKRNRKS
jgi:hypothetical protein